MKAYNVVVSSPRAGVINQGVLADLNDVIFSSIASIETMMYITGSKVVLTSLKCSLDESTLEMEYCYPSGQVFATVIAEMVDIGDPDDQMTDGVPQAVVDQTNDIIAQLMQDSKN